MNSQGALSLAVLAMIVYLLFRISTRQPYGVALFGFGVLFLAWLFE